MHRALLCLALIGCYAPTYREGLVCAQGPDPCPPGQRCFSGTCYLSSRDGAPDDTDNADAEIDSGACVAGGFCLETTPVTGDLTGVWGSAADRLWVVGTGGVWSYNQGTWTKEPPSGSFLAVHGLANNAVWVVASNGGVSFWNGTTWSSTTAGVAALRAVVGVSINEAWAAGGASRAWHFTNAPPWTQVTTGLSGNAYALAASSASEVYLSGDDAAAGTPNGTLFRFQPSAGWTRIGGNPPIPMTFHAMWHSPNQLFIAGADNDSGELFRYPVGGAVVTDRTSPARLYAIHGISDGDVWAAGSEGTVLKRTTSGMWLPVLGAGNVMLRGVAAFPTKVWVVGDNARVFSLSR